LKSHKDINIEEMKQQHRHPHLRPQLLKDFGSWNYTNVPASNQQRKKITSNDIDKDDQYDGQQEEEDLTCMIEGCSAMGEEVIALLDESSLSDVDKYDVHHYDEASLSSPPPPPQRNGFKNKKSSSDDNNDEDNNNDNLIPAVVCSKHFDKLIEEAYTAKSVPRGRRRILGHDVCY
jgi:hypothetical protein